jgi:hypothetical protein
MDHIMSLMESNDPYLMKAAFLEVPPNGLEAATREISLLIGQDNFGLFPVKQGRVENMAPYRTQFRGGWIATGRPPKLAEPPDRPRRSPVYDDAHLAVAGTVRCTQMVDEQGATEACTLPWTWEAGLSDMLTAQRVRQAGTRGQSAV